MRISEPVLLALLLLGGCGQGQERQGTATAQSQQPILCRMAGEAVLHPVCLVEREGELSLLTIRRPDGGFRRLRIVADGHGVIAADGAEHAKVTILSDKRIDVTVGGDVYQFPAKIAVAE